MRKDWRCLFCIPLLLAGAVACSSGGGSSSSEPPATVADDSNSAEPAADATATYMLFVGALADGDYGKFFPVTIASDGTTVTVTDPCGQEYAGTGTLSGDQLTYTTTADEVYTGTLEALVTSDGLTCGQQWLDAKLEVTHSDRPGGIDPEQDAIGVLLVDNGQLTGPYSGSTLSSTVLFNTRIRSYFYSMYHGLPAWFRYAQPTHTFIRGGYAIGGISLKIGTTITRGQTVEVGETSYPDCYKAVYAYIYAEVPPATDDYPLQITRYFKEGIGVVKVVEETMAPNVFTAGLVDYIGHGDGIVPLATENSWIFSWYKNAASEPLFTEMITVTDVIPNGTTYNLAPGEVP